MTTEPASVLLVEDHEDTRKMLELLLEEWGYRATIVETATAGLRHLLEHSFDLIILDNWLPDLDGIELCRQVRQFDRQTPIIFYSAAAMGSEDRAAFEAGADDYVYKGNGLGPLRESISLALGKPGRQPRKLAT